MPRKRISYWEGTPAQFQLIQEIQTLKRQEMGLVGMDALASDDNVMTNPMTGEPVPEKDLRYARTHLHQLYESGAIKDARWAFLWYH